MDQDPVNPPEHEQIKVRDMSRQADLVISFSSWALYTALGLTAAIFVGQKIFSEQFIDLMKPDNTIWQLVVAIYFASWVFGTRFDKKNEEDTYVSAPYRGKLRIFDICCVLSVTGMFALFTVIGSANDRNNFLSQLINSVSGIDITRIKTKYDNYGAISLLIFLNALWIINIPLWIYFVRRYVDPMRERSRLLLESQRKYLSLEKIRALDDYLRGTWQIWRFFFGMFYLSVVDILVVIHATPDVSLRKYHYILLCAYLLAIEGWIWFERFKVRSSLKLLEFLSLRYQVTIPTLPLKDMT